MIVVVGGNGLALALAQDGSSDSEWIQSAGGRCLESTAKYPAT